MIAKWGVGHVLLPATPVPESAPLMWFHIVSGRKSTGRHLTGTKIVLNEPAMTPTPAAWQVAIIFAYWARVPRLDVRVYETGW